MLFNSFEFLLFFPLSIILYFATPHNYRWVWLLFASYFFYAWWKFEYLALIIVSTLIDYLTAIKISLAPDKKSRKFYLYLSLFSNLGMLFFFKYYGFVTGNLQQIFNFSGINYNFPLFDLLLPVGISFYTFQTLSYTIDVYRGNILPERHLGIFALYVSFWPQLVAGPIERSSHLLPQFRQHHSFDYDRIRAGLIRIAWGFFKKLVIADRMAILVNQVYNDTPECGGGMYILATVFFAFQIYCDFSGYSDIAIGSARIMGFDLMENFRRPYFSRSIQEFWGRWHISLSTWFRDYVYIPLGGNRVVKWRWYYNLFITFVISGFWHGAKWTFIIWGALHGMLLIIQQLISFRKNRKWYIPFVFVLVCFGWLFFRSDSIEHSGLLLKKIAESPLEFNLNVFNYTYLIHLIYGFAAIILLIFTEWMIKDNTVESIITRFKPVYRWSFYTSLILIILWFGVFTNNEFIYFQF